MAWITCEKGPGPLSPFCLWGSKIRSTTYGERSRGPVFEAKREGGSRMGKRSVIIIHTSTCIT